MPELRLFTSPRIWKGPKRSTPTEDQGRAGLKRPNDKGDIIWEASCLSLFRHVAHLDLILLTIRPTETIQQRVRIFGTSVLIPKWVDRCTISSYNQENLCSLGRMGISNLLYDTSFHISTRFLTPNTFQQFQNYAV